MSGNDRSSGYDRAVNDWYVEPRWAVDALLNVETFEGTTWDPACGCGTIPSALRDRGMAWTASDLVYRGFDGAGGGSDFIAEGKSLFVGIQNVITNPPFALASQFALRALDVADHKVAILQRLAWLEGIERKRMFEATPLSKVWVFSRRVSMPPGGSDIPAKSGSVAFAWFVWDKRHFGPPALGWLS